MLLLLLVLCFAILVTGRSTQQTRGVGQKLAFVGENDDAEEVRFLTGSGTGGSNSASINNLIQQLLGGLRPTSGTATLTGVADLINANAGTGGNTGTASNSGNSIANLLLPQVTGGSLQGANTRRRRRPSTRRRNRNRNRNRGQKRNRNRRQRRSQVYLGRSRPSNASKSK